MSWVKFSVAVAATSLALVIGLVATGAVIAGNALASTVPMAFAQRGIPFGPGGAGPQGGWNLPPELASLKDVPADQRFAHFKGVQVSLTDKDGKPIAISVTPGVAQSVSPTSLTITGNDGAAHTYTLTDQTMTRGNPLASGQNVVVVTVDNTTTARAVFNAAPGDWAHR
jgi:hypothetical protein